MSRNSHLAPDCNPAPRLLLKTFHIHSTRTNQNTLEVVIRILINWDRDSFLQFLGWGVGASSSTGDFKGPVDLIVSSTQIFHVSQHLTTTVRRGERLLRSEQHMKAKLVPVPAALSSVHREYVFRGYSDDSHCRRKSVLDLHQCPNMHVSSVKPKRRA